MKNTRGSEWNKWDLHIHTASSYDSPYKADDADELLCQALAENDIKAVAITDHFKIDKTRIEHLRKLAPEIVFFPGVELRTDKGANNLHLILIFSELSDLETLSADFNAIMLRTLAKSKESDETIYWQFDDIVEFCKNHGGLISIHAGKKSNGIDKEISNALPVKEAIKSDIAKLITDKTIKQLTLNGSPMEKGLLNELKIAHDKKNDLISTSDIEEKKYQKYLNDLQDWEKEKQKIIGSQDTEDCLTYYKSEKEYLDNILETDYHRAREERNIKFKELFVLKQRIVIIYQEIYAPIEQEIKKLLGDLEETIEFQAEMQLMDNDFSNKILSSISQRFAGVFKGKTEANNRITRLLRSTEFSDENSVLDLVNSIILAVDEDIDNSEKKITDKKEFYDYLYGLEYVGVSFKLKMGGRDLEELSPGERGIVLLIFYLALSQNSIPIIIDQPEDNLDNQSVYNKLVPCICAAKQKRQVIIVTHNPNIAVACDAEQIICCKMDKNTHKITYLSGAIEDQEIKQNVVDILEGTMPAFDLRRRKYV